MARTDSKWNDRGSYIETTNPLGYDILVNGTNKYINFNTLVGSSGYGFRDNGGVMEFKNSGGAWTPIGGGGGGGTPATTVVSETAFGQASAVGVSTDYARADHTHGSPTDPIPAHLAAPDPHPQYALDSDLAGLQSGILFENEGVALGASGTVNELDFVGAGVNAVRVGNKVTVTIAGGGGSVTVTEIEVDMGNKSPSKRFTVTDGAITPANKILVFPSPNVATGRKGNDWELDSAIFTALAGTGNFLLSIVSPFRMRGYRKLYYQVV